MIASEYLVNYGRAGEFGRFRTQKPLALERGNRVVVRTYRGVEIGNVLRPAAPGHASFLPNTTVGQLLRPFGPDDACLAAEIHNRENLLLEDAARIAQEMELPVAVLDVELLLDKEHAVFHHLCWDTCDVRPFVSTLSRTFGLHVLLNDVAQSRIDDAEAVEEHGSCGSCSSDGGCGSCGSGGGCGSCKTPTAVAIHHEVNELVRTPLL